MEGLKEVRCKKCGRLLCRAAGEVEVKCPRCKEMNREKTQG